MSTDESTLGEVVSGWVPATRRCLACRARPPRGRRARRAKVLLLVGPKGAGKTTLGRELAKRPGVRFVPVEAIAKEVLASMGNVIDERYARRAFDAILRELRDLERRHSTLVLETTGASEHSRDFVRRLANRYELALVRVTASPSECEARILARDPSAQIAVSRAMVREMHGRFEALTWPWSVSVENGGGRSIDEASSEILPLVRN
jgi:XRE family transcriptional regulator, aerobic/anaerobic benzoate catabolism transcriptional regulator